MEPRHVVHALRRWEEEARAEISDGELVAVNVTRTPQADNDQGFEFIGTLSSLFSSMYLSSTSDADRVTRLGINVSGGSLGSLIPDDYDSDTLPLWRIQQINRAAALSGAGMIFVFGNGLSIGFDPRLATDRHHRPRGRLARRHVHGRAARTRRARDARGSRYRARGGRPGQIRTARGTPRPSGGRARGRAAPLHRPGTIPLLAKLRDAADGLRQHYVRIVGTVLREVDACCVMEDADPERLASWQTMNAFAAELVKRRATVFTLNYDSLLMSALLDQTGLSTTGFGSAAERPARPWNEAATLYQLHGSVAWRRGLMGGVQVTASDRPG